MYEFSSTTKTMNSFSRVHRCLKWCVLLWLMITGGTGFAQEWSEQYILNGTGDWYETRPAFLSNTYFLQEPDPTIGTATAEFSSGNVVITFDPVVGAVGMTEFIVEYFPGPYPNFAPSTLAFRIFVDSSHVKTEPDYQIVLADSTVTVDVLANDESDGGGELSIESIAASDHGDVIIFAEGDSVSFTPDPGYIGMAYFTYVVVDALGSAAHEEVSICVISNDPISDHEVISLATDSRTPLAVFMPMSGFEEDPDDGPDHGSLDSVAAEVFRYTPDEDFDGIDTFTLIIGSDYSREVHVRVFEQDAPNEYLIPDEVFTHLSESVTFDPRQNDLKTNYDIHSYTEPLKGTLEFDEDLNEFTYTPIPGYSSVEEFTYSMSFLGKYEETTVKIYVGNLPPVNTERYNLTTHQNVPVVLNYQIPLEPFDFYITGVNPINLPLELPGEGALSLYEGETTLSVLCDEVSGYDLIKYTPTEDFVGRDSFEILYCVEPDACTLVQIAIEVEDFGDLGPCPCVDDCVWPGDADANGIVDMQDLLYVGWNIGLTGDNRDYTDNSVWLGQHSDNWEIMEVTGDVNAKYTDCNGDGVVSTDDAAAIEEHFLRTHALIPEIPGLKLDAPFILVPHQTVLDSGDLAVFDIVVGDELYPVYDMHGIHFALNLPADLVDLSSLEITFNNDSWLSHAGPSMQMELQPWEGRVDAGFSRVDGKPASGAGLIGNMTFIVEDDIEGFPPPGALIPFNIDIIGVGSSDTKGEIRELEGNMGELFFKVPGGRDLGLRSEAPEPGVLHAYPNPVTEGRLNLHYNGDTNIRRVEMYDASGRMVFGKVLDNRREELDVSSLPSGLYIVRAVTDDGAFTKKVKVLGQK